METKKLPSGKELVMTMAPFADGHRLLKVVAREIESVRFSGDVLKEPDAIKNLIMRAIYSSDVEQALKPCLARCNYDKKQIKTYSHFMFIPEHGIHVALGSPEKRDGFKPSFDDSN